MADPTSDNGHTRLGKTAEKLILKVNHFRALVNDYVQATACEVFFHEKLLNQGKKYKFITFLSGGHCYHSSSGGENMQITGQ